MNKSLSFTLKMVLSIIICHVIGEGIAFLAVALTGLLFAFGIIGIIIAIVTTIPIAIVAGTLPIWFPIYFTSHPHIFDKKIKTA